MDMPRAEFWLWWRAAVEKREIEEKLIKDALND